MKKKSNIIILVVLAISLMFIGINDVSAKTLNDLYSQLSKLEAQKKANDANKKLTQSEISSINQQITDTYKQIEKTKEDIVVAENNIVSSEEKIKSKNEESKQLLKYLQTSTGDNAYLDYLFDASDYTDFIYRYSIVSQLSDYNNNMITEMENLIKELEKSKVDLANKTVELENKRASLTEKKYLLGSQLNTYDESANDINEDIADLKKEINYYKNELKCSDTIDLTECSRIPYATGFKYPLNSGKVSSMYGDRCFWLNGEWYCDFHTGIDFSVSEGTSVYAVASGKVARIIRASSCGGNKVYIYHTVNGRNYTTAYLHLLSINVSVNQIVYDTTVIGKSGGGSTASNRGGYDRCTTGPHLHFGIANTHNATSFNSYTVNPNTIFTKLTYKGFSWSSR